MTKNITIPNNETISEYYSYSWDKSECYIRTTDNFLNKPKKIWLCLSGIHGYMNPWTKYLQTGENMLHSSHIWLSTYISIPEMDFRHVNILDTNSLSSFNFTYMIFQQWILKSLQPDLDFMVNPSMDFPITEFNTLESQLQNTEIWGLCQTFTLSFFILLLHKPHICMRNISNILSNKEYYERIIIVKGLLQNGEYLRSLVSRKKISFFEKIKN
jgi:hypothetical protein